MSVISLPHSFQFLSFIGLNIQQVYSRHGQARASVKLFKWFNAELPDSGKRTLCAYDFDVDKGTVSNERLIIRVDSNGVDKFIGIFDGGVIDTEGYLWYAVCEFVPLLCFPRSLVIV
jgi:hypothetical protein